VQTVGGTQVKDVLAFERVRHVVAFMPLSGVVEQHAHIGTAFEIRESESLVATDDA
jgi:hypothetical protein